MGKEGRRRGREGGKKEEKKGKGEGKRKKNGEEEMAMLHICLDGQTNDPKISVYEGVRKNVGF